MEPHWFLLPTTLTSLSSWLTEFWCLAGIADFWMYSGSTALATNHRHGEDTRILRVSKQNCEVDRMKRWYGPASAFLLAMIIWESALRFGIVSPAALAYPMEVLKAFPSMFSPRGNLADLASTIYRASMAFVLSIPLGVGPGVLLFYVIPLQIPGK